MSVSWRDFLKREADAVVKTWPTTKAISIHGKKEINEPDALLFSEDAYISLDDLMSGIPCSYPFAYCAGRYETLADEWKESGKQYVALVNKNETIVIRVPDGLGKKPYIHDQLCGRRLTPWLQHVVWNDRNKADCATLIDSAVTLALLRHEHASPDTITAQQKSDFITTLKLFCDSFLYSKNHPQILWTEWWIDVRRTVPAAPLVPLKFNLWKILSLAPPIAGQEAKLTKAQHSRLHLLVNPAYNPRYDLTTAWTKTEYNEWIDIVQKGYSMLPWEWVHTKASYQAIRASGLDVITPGGEDGLKNDDMRKSLSVFRIKQLSVDTALPIRSHRFKVVADDVASTCWATTTASGSDASTDLNQEVGDAPNPLDTVSQPATIAEDSHRSIHTEIDPHLQTINPQVIRVMKEEELEALKRRTPRFAAGSISVMDIAEMTNTTILREGSHVEELDQDEESESDPGDDHPHWKDIARNPSLHGQALDFQRLVSRCTPQEIEQRKPPFPPALGLFYALRALTM